MKNRIKLFGIIAIVAIIGFSMAACDNGSGGDGGGGGGDSGLNGTWVSGSERMVLSNGSFTISDNYVDIMKGTYSASGSSITMTVTQYTGAFLIDYGFDFGISRTQWYTQQSLRTPVINYFVSLGITQSEAEAAYNELAPSLAQMFFSGTGTVSGNTLNIFDDTYTKN